MLKTKIFEIVMLLCFGAAWPLSIYRVWKTKISTGKSMLFLNVIFIGYLSGVMHKVFVDYNNVIYLYILNALMVFIDMCLTIKYRAR